MHSYGVHEALYQICKIHVPGSGVLAIRQGQYGHILKMYRQKYKKIFSIYSTINSEKGNAWI